MAQKLKVTLKKSGNGYPEAQKRVIQSLGLRKLNSSVVHADTPAIRGMVRKISHLVTVEEVE
ncbi:MAG: 50S ribosomal protein L30 [Syntrophomonadaceae bacterium]|nr:50S ribosomal protein L30 [Syntrophomonadaceae bacterium]